MRCLRCGANAPDGSWFCSACGAPTNPGRDRPSPDEEATRSRPTPPPGARTPGSSGWQTSSGSIDHGRFTPGTILADRYRVIGLLGRGGMGEVYRADDLRLGQAVALKFLPEELAQNAKRLAQFHSEVRVARQVAHPNVCRVYDIGDADGLLYLSMEYVDGEDLSASLRRIGRFPEDKALELARQICAGLAAAHERGVIHRDLKPSNIMLDASGRVRLMDFGLAAVGVVDDARAGTPAYMAPEQIDGREVTPRSDIYALGLVLYELFTGRRAFVAASIADLVLQQASGDVTAPTEIVKTLDPAIERAILRCLEREPQRRPSSAIVVAASLPGGDPLAAALAAGETPSPAMVAAAGSETATVTPRAGLALVGLALALLVAAAALSDRATLVARVPPVKPVDVLVDRAASIRRELGYTEPVVDTAFGFMTDGDYLAWAERRGGADPWWHLATGRPAVIQFWHRSSPNALVPFDSLSRVTVNDPPAADTAGMVAIALDGEGRLVALEATPPQLEAPAPAAHVDWDRVFSAAGLDRSTFGETTPAWTPNTHTDERRAWAGLLPGTRDIRVGIEAAGYRGRPVMFEIVGPWTRAQRDVAYQVPPRAVAIGQVAVIGIFAGAGWIAWRNVRLARGDRRGAGRLALWMASVLMVRWVIDRDHVKDTGLEIGRMWAHLGGALFVGGLLFVLYLAAEPYVRRIWPTMLVTWTRLISGRVRDPLVGRDLLIGTVLGLATASLQLSENVLPVLMGRPEPRPIGIDVDTLLGARALTVGLIQAVIQSVLFGPVALVFASLLRRVVRRGWIAAGLLAVMYATLALTRDAEPIWLHFVVDLAAALAVVFVFVRFGLFAAIVSFVVNGVASLPITLDPSKFYAGEGAVAMGCVLAIACAGYWLARADEPLFGNRPAS